MRILFAGTPEPAVPSLRAVASQHSVAAVLTRPDAPIGRKRVLTPSPVKTAAQELGLPVIEASRLVGDVVTEIEKLEVDAVAVVAYGALAGPRSLAAARLGWYNLHFSLLPDYRGAAPVQRALIDGHTTSGVTVFRLDEGMDTGDIVSALELPLDHVDAGAALADYAEKGAAVLADALTAVENGTAQFTPQPAEGTLAPKITAADAQLDFQLPAEQLIARSRGTSPAPGPWSTIGGKRTKLGPLAPAEGSLEPGHTASAHGGMLIGTGSHPVFIETIQPFGKQRMAAADFLRGNPGVRFDLGEDA